MDIYILKELLLVTPLILFALTVHEVSHGWMAEKFGDNTARLLGRITLNPIAHLDPMGTLMMFLAHFGWAKPVPVDPRKLRDPRGDMVWVSLAGPGSNVLLAVVFGLGVRVCLPWIIDSGYINDGSIFGIVAALLILGMEINLGLGLFNLIPIHPLDGSKILTGLLPLNLAYQYQQFERYGMVIIFTIFIFGQIVHFPIFSLILGAPMALLAKVITGYNYPVLMRLLGVLLT